MDSTLSIALPSRERGIIEDIAMVNGQSLGQVVRELLAIGPKARKCES
jgi:hypothetical protein